VGGLPTGTINGFTVDPKNSKVMYVALRDGVFRSDDAGKAWRRVAGGPKNVAALTMNPKRPGEVFAITADGKLYLSRDAGGQWGEAR